MKSAPSHAEAELVKLAVMTAADRPQMATEVFALMINGADSVLTPDETDEVWREAVYQEWATRSGDGTFSLTEAGRQIIAASRKRFFSPHRIFEQTCP